MPQRLTDFLSHVSRICLRTVTDFYRGHGLTRSASLAYTTLLAIAPLSILIISIVSFFPFFDQILSQLEKFIFANFVPHTGHAILNVVEKFQSQARDLPWISFVFMAITAYLILFNMESHLNELWGVKRRRFFALSFLIHWLTLIIGPLLLCTSIAASSLLASTRWLNGHDFNDLAFFLPFTCSFLAYTFLYLTLPYCKVKLKHVLVGAFFAALCFEGAKIGFSLYVRLVPTYTIIYGALAVIPLFLLWLYVSSIIFLLGGQLVNSLRIR